jgi:RNA polymerase sigma-70 factor (ECF subfamily)
MKAAFSRMEIIMEQGANAYRRYLDGDQNAFAEIIEEFRDPVTFFIQRYVHDICAAEDIAADVFMQLVVNPQKYRFDTPLKTYLFVMARSRALDHLRRVKRRKQVPLEETEDTLADTQDLEEQVLQNEEKRRLHEAIGQLPEPQQIAVHLVYFESCSYEEAARIMKKTAKQVDNLLYRAKQALRGILGEGRVQEQ